MSWIFGAIGNFTQEDAAGFSLHHSNPFYHIRRDHLYITAGGLRETCLSNIANETQTTGWILCGLGIKRGIAPSFMNADDWEQVLSNRDFQTKDYDGHFICIRWDGNTVNCITDVLGVRDLFIAKCNGFTIFSTRLDWITRVKKNCSINLEEFGARWLFTNQLSRESTVQGVGHLVGGSATITGNSFTIKNIPWNPETTIPSTADETTAALEQIVVFPVLTGKKITVCLSGGIDSRTIMALAVKNKGDEFDTCTFGNPDHPDARIAKWLCKAIDVHNTTLNEPIPPIDILLDMLREYIGYTFVSNPASQILQLRYMPRLYENDRTIIDGGWGGWWRREIANRILYAGKNALRHGDATGISKHVTLFRGDIFNDETLLCMRTGAINQIQRLIGEMPAIDDLGMENWLDLYSTRSRLINMYNCEQIRMDNYVVSYMPFIQPSLLNMVLTMPLQYRRNARLFRTILRRYQPAITHIPLATNDTTYPYLLSSLPLRIWTGVKRKAGLCFHNPTTTQFLLILKEFIQDTVQSSAVKQCGLYHHCKLEEITTKFYNGRSEYTSQIDWWLSFEIWRQTL